MRILHIDTEMGWRGGENQLRLLLEGLARTDVESFVAARPGSAAAQRLATLAPVFTCPMRGGIDPIAAMRLASFCKRQKIDLIDAHTANGHGLGLIIKLLLPNLKLVVHRRVDNIPKTNTFNRLKYNSSQVDRYIAISSAIHDVLVDYGIPSARITVVRSAVPDNPYHGLDHLQEKEALAKAYGLGTDLVFFGNASALSPQKGYPTLLNAAKSLKDRGVPFHCFIAGDGELRASLEKQRMDLGLEYDVTFLGFIEEVPRFLTALDILAMPSTNEGLGTLLLDASLAGCAIAATRVGGIPEAVIHGKTGLLSCVGDASGLAAHLKQLIENPELRRELSANSRALTAREFSVGSMVGGNLAVYRQLVDHK